MLRQAPNIVMVGEIRDLETAEIAINASLTGHMVFSTLHTNDAPGAVTRLIDIGVKPFSCRRRSARRWPSGSSAKSANIASGPYVPDAKEVRSLNINPAQAATRPSRRVTVAPIATRTATADGWESSKSSS